MLTKGNTTPKLQPQGQVTEELNALTVALDYTNELVSDLYIRLDICLTQYDEAAGPSCTPCKAPASSILAGGLQEKRDRVAYINSRLIELIGRVTL